MPHSDIPWQRLGPLYVPPGSTEQARSQGQPVRVYPAGMEALAGAGGDIGRQIGYSGVRAVGGEVNSDHNTSLIPTVWRGDDATIGVVDQMVREDPVAKAVVQSWTLPVLRSNWKVEPASDQPIDLEIADFVALNLFEYQRGGWMPWLDQVVAYLWRGFSLFEIVAQYKPDLGKTCIGKLPVILPRSVFSWGLYPDDQWGIEQTAPTGDPIVGSGNSYGPRRTVTIGPEKLLRFTWDSDGDNPEGTSILRPCYGAWKQRRLYLKLEAAGFERGAFGIPYVEIDPRARQGDSATVNEILRELRTGSRAWATLPPGYTLKFADFPMKGAEIREARIAAGRDMARAALASFLFTGESAGSFALIRGQLDHYQMAIQGAADTIADTMNTGPGSLVKRLVDWNYPNVTSYPRLTPGSLSVGDPSLLVTAIKAATEAGVLTPDGQVERSVRVALGLPEIPEQPLEPPDTAPAPPEAATPPPSTPETAVAPAQAPEDSSAAAQEVEGLAAVGRPAQLLEQGVYAANGRPLQPFEQVCRLDETIGKMEGTKDALARVVVQWRESVADAYAARLAAAGKLSKLRSVAVPDQGRLLQMLKVELRGGYRAGRASVKSELERVQANPDLAQAIDEGDFEVTRDEIQGFHEHAPGCPGCQSGQLHLEGIAPKKRNRVRAPKAKASGFSVTDGLKPETTISELATTTAGGVTDRMTGTAVTAAQASSTAGVIGKAELAATTAAAVKALSVGPDLVQAQRDANTIFGLGRVQEARAGDVEWARYSTMLESNVCEPCAQLDGAKFPISDADEYSTPNPSCLGGDQCNCIQIYLPK